MLKRGTSVKLDKPGNILENSHVYKSSSISLLKSAKESYEQENIKYPIDMEIDIILGQKPKLILSYKDFLIEKTSENIVEKAQKISLTKEKIEEQLSKLGDTNYYLSNIKINLNEEVFLPVSVLNQLRRDAIEELNSGIIRYNNREEIDMREYRETKSKVFNIIKAKDVSKRLLSVKVSNVSQIKKLDFEKLDRIYIGFFDGIEDFVQSLNKLNKEVYLWTNKILYEKDIEILDRTIKPIEDKIHGISVSNLGSLKYVRDRYKLRIHGDIGLNIFNSFSADYLRSIGLESMTLSPELNMGQIKKITEKTGGIMESIVYGYLPVMVMKHCPMSLVKNCKDDSKCSSCNFARGYGLRDRMDMIFPMERNGELSTIYNSVPLMVIDSLNTIYKSGISMARLDFTVESRNIEDIQNIYYDYSKGLISEFEVNEFLRDFRKENKITNGHYFRGII